MTRDDRGDDVGELQRRLAAAGFEPAGIEPGVFGLATEAALRAFQEVRGLRADGVCDAITWAALLEASWELGDRHLYLRQPNLRGDDVAELQRILGALGFDAGRIDGIYGPLAYQAVNEFQRNVGLVPDGVCGFETFDALRRLGGRVVSGAPAIASVREQEILRDLTPRLSRKRIALGCYGGLDVITRAIGRQLRSGGASVAELDGQEAVQAASANRFGADVYLGIGISDTPGLSYYEVAGFVSHGGRSLATMLHDRLRARELAIDPPRGMRLPILRETRMPAVLYDLGPIGVVVHHAPEIAETAATTLREWIDAASTERAATKGDVARS